MTYNLFFLLTGDPGRQTFDPDLLGEMVKIEQGSNLLGQNFNLIARYVRKVHSDEHIRKCLRYSAGRSFLDIIRPSDIAYIVSIIKNNKGMWDQDIQMRELGAEAMGNLNNEIQRTYKSKCIQMRTKVFLTLLTMT